MKFQKLASVLITLVFITDFVALAPVPYTEAAVTPGKKMFKVTAYYSPLPGQSYYSKGSYEAEVALNGQGVAGASGRKVFPGMLAAPKDYPFGTKVYLEGLGIGTVADRGGAIVNQGVRGQEYDRLDVWMGFGEEGLKRSMKWGVRFVSGEILSSTTVADTISFDGGLPPVVATSLPQNTALDVSKAESQKIEKTVESNALAASFPTEMGKGSNGPEVRVLQAALMKAGFYKGGMTGDYDANTISAVLSFQLENKIVENDDSHAAGYFGVSTRKLLMNALTKKGVTMEQIKEVAFRSGIADAPVVAKEQPKVQPKLQNSVQLGTKKEITTNNIPAPARIETKQFVTTPIATSPVAMPEGGKIVFANDIEGEKKIQLSSFGVMNAPLPMSTQEVRALQKKLRSLGMFDGEFTGIMGDNTRRALSRVQIQGSLSVTDGTYNIETRDYIGSLWSMHVATWGFANRLHKGDSGADVKKLQQLLQEQKLYTGEAHGYFDDATEKAVFKFQLKQKIVKDIDDLGAGTVGPTTMGNLNSLLFRL